MPSHAYRNAIGGDFRACDAWLAAHDDPSWRALFEAQRYAAGLQAAMGAPAVEGEAAALYAIERARIAGALLDPNAPGAWGDAIHGTLEVETALAMEQRASRDRAADRVVEAASLAALAALHGGDVDRATSIARRASRMARTEAMPQLEYLAHLVLARVRRSAGRPHLATRILTSLARAAPPLWRGWIALELALAGAPGPAAAIARAAVDGPAAQAAQALAVALESLARGGAVDVGDAGRVLHGPFAREIDAIRAAIDPSASADDPFLRGDTHALPAALTGVALSAPPFVVSSPLGARRALLAIDLPRQPRTETAIAITLLTGAIEKDDLFARIYGFAYDAGLHAGIYDVLLHRVRAYLGDRAELIRDGDTLSIAVRAPIVVPDPRCERPLDDRVLRALAEGAESAKDTAAKLGVPLRTVQAILAQLVDEGACRAQKEGRKVSYRVEDTTFSEPTRG